MLLALGATLLVMIVLGWEVLGPVARERWERVRFSRALARERRGIVVYDPGRERRAEAKARALLRSCVNDEEWEMYRDLGFIRVWGGQAAAGEDAPHAYLIYPHRPIVCFVPQTHRLLNEYCVAFPDETRPYGSPRLPGSDDVLAKWMALTGDERGLIASANMHLPGRQVDPTRVRRDLLRLGQWERRRMAGEPTGAAH